MVRRGLIVALLLMLLMAHAGTAGEASGAYPRETPGPLTSALSHCVVGLTDNGRTFSLRPGDHLVLALGMDYSWIVVAEGSGVLEAVPSPVYQIGCQGEYVARRAGQARLLAFGSPACQPAQSPRSAQAQQVVVYVIVQ